MNTTQHDAMVQHMIAQMHPLLSSITRSAGLSSTIYMTPTRRDALIHTLRTCLARVTPATGWAAHPPVIYLSHGCAHLTHVQRLAWDVGVDISSFCVIPVVPITTSTRHDTTGREEHCDCWMRCWDNTCDIHAHATHVPSDVRTCLLMLHAHVDVRSRPPLPLRYGYRRIPIRTHT